MLTAFYRHMPPRSSCLVLSEMPINSRGSAAIPASLMVSCFLLAWHRWRRPCPTGATLFGWCFAVILKACGRWQGHTALSWHGVISSLQEDKLTWGGVGEENGGMTLQLGAIDLIQEFTQYLKNSFNIFFLFFVWCTLSFVFFLACLF